MAHITLHEVGPRDGLQMEREVVPLETKETWIRAVARCGVDIVQVGSFVHPERVPQMADTDALFRRLAAHPPGDAVLSGLVLNEKGLERAALCGAGMLCMGASASDTHSRANTGMGSAEALRRIVAMGRSASAGEAAGAGVGAVGVRLWIRGTDRRRSRAPHGGHVPRGRAAAVSLADTAGHASPGQVERLFGALRRLEPAAEYACHFHDTYGVGMANIFAALRAGVTIVETSFAGLGGCPFTKVAAGNVATEDFVHALQRDGRRTDVDLEGLLAVGPPGGGSSPARDARSAAADGTHRAEAMMGRAILDGLRVLDLTNVLSGPFATLHLALLGADVIKIENPRDGDLARKLGVRPELNEQLMGTSFLAQNANKKSVTLNLKPPRARPSSASW
jgi:hydroxymethylglutaryl-CoA lyase